MDDSLPKLKSRFERAQTRTKDVAAPDELTLAEIAWPLISEEGDRIVESLRAALESGTMSEAAADAVLDRMVAAGYAQVFRAAGQALVVELGAAKSTGLLAGENSEEQYAFFARCLADPAFGFSVLDRYPVLALQLQTIARNWADANVELLERLIADRHALAERFGGGDAQLSDIALTQGDSHRSGRTTAVLHFDSGLRTVYKPRPLAAEAHFRAFAAWFNGRLGEERILLPDCLDRGEYGWCEFVEHMPARGSEEISHYFRAFGSVLAVSYALGITDLHSENLIARGQWPVLVDLETLLSPLQTLGPVEGAARPFARAMRESVLASGLLPTRVSASEGGTGALDLSGITDLAGQVTPFALPAWQDARTADMRLDYRRRALEGHDNAVRSAEGVARPEIHCEAVIAGFVEAYDLIAENRLALRAADGPLARFRSDPVRVVIRPTFLYEHFLTAGGDPEFLADAATKRAFFRNGLAEVSSELPALRAPIEAETRDLLDNDIPYFSARADSTELIGARGERVDGTIEQSGLDAALRRLDGMGEADRELQCRFIRASLARADFPAPAPAVRLKLPSTDSAHALAGEIGGAIAERICAQAVIEAATGRRSWITLREGQGGTLATALAGLDLYAGMPGIALFLAAAGDVLARTEYLAAARGAVEEILHRLDGGEVLPAHGAFAGRPGVAYALGAIAPLMPGLALERRAVELLAAAGEPPGSAAELDVIEGMSGTLLVCLSVRRAVSRSEWSGALLERARALGGTIMDRIRAGEGLRSLPAGFAHGRAGIAFALLQLERTAGDERAGRLGRTLLAQLQPAGDFDTEGDSWCRGAGGAALLGKAGRPGPTPDGANDCLCHGRAGTLMIRQAEAGKALSGTSDADADNLRFLEAIARDGVVCGTINGIETPALMDGLAGVGLATLRIVAPDRVPNVLTLGLDSV